MASALFVVIGISLLAWAAVVNPVIAQPTPTTSPSTSAPTTPTTSPTTATTTPSTTAAPSTTVPRTTTTAASTTTSTTKPATTSTTSKAKGSSDAGTIAGIVIAAVVVLGLLVALIVALVRRGRRTQWWANARLAAADSAALSAAVERALSLLRDPGAAAQAWGDLNNRVAQLRGRLRTLARTGPDPEATAAANRVSQALDAVQVAIDTDRGLRIGPPPPTDDQLGYSEAVLRQRAGELDRAAQELEVLDPAG